MAAEGLLPDGSRSFDRARLRMPKKRLVLPDVAEHMDASQYLATMAAEKIADSLPAGLGQKDLRIGVALGLESKTERGVRANERVFLDRLSRVARRAGASPEMLGVRKAITTKVIPSGPYTLPGLMPTSRPAALRTPSTGTVPTSSSIGAKDRWFKHWMPVSSSWRRAIARLSWRGP